MAPSRAGLGVAVAWMFPWDWLAARGAHERMACGRGQALARTAMPGGKATHDTIDAPKMAVLLRGGRLPQASGSPAPRRAPRAL